MNEREQALLRQLGRTARTMYAAFEAEVGCALPRWRILQALYEQTHATQKELVKQLAMDPGAMTRQMKALEREGLITRRSNPEDNRLTTVVLTPAGMNAIVTKQSTRKTFSKKALRGLPTDKLDTAMSILKKLEERFRGMNGSREQGS
jgi:MarR family transcriptional regulator, organic hydroperoxide resistance regulator